jgi:hypothetical protein
MIKVSSIYDKKIKSVEIKPQNLKHKAHGSYILTNLPFNYYFNHENYSS